MKEASFENKVTIANADGAVNFSGELSADGKSYILTLDKALKVGEYTITIGAVTSAYDAEYASSEHTVQVSDAKIIFAENYDGTAVQEPKVLKTSSSTATHSTGEETNGNKYIKINASWANYGYEFDAITGGKVKVKFDFSYDTASADSYIRFGDINQSGSEYQPLTLIYQNNSKGWFGVGSGINSNGITSTLSDGTWYTYEGTFDIDNRGVSVVVKERDSGTQLGAYENTAFVERGSTRNEFTGWPGVNNFKNLVIHNNINLDSVEISYVYDKPEVTDADISIRNASGTASADFTAVDPNVTAIDIDFGVLMDIDTLTAANVSLVNTDLNQTVDYSGTLSGKMYTLAFSPLAENTNYKLTISGDVANVDGVALGSDYTLSFKTKSASISGAIGKVTIGTSEVNSFADLADGTVSVNVSVTNSTTEPCENVLLVAYYDATGTMLDAEVAAVGPIAAGQSLNEAKNVDIAKPANTTKVKIMLWSGFKTLVPLCEHKEF